MSSCASGSLYVDRNVSIIGSTSASASAASGAQRGPTSRAARPPNATSAQPPTSAGTSSIVVQPPIQLNGARVSPVPDMNCAASRSPVG
jgi:hypothetical protein